MKTAFLCFLMAFCSNPAWADFSATRMFYHPRYIGDHDPFILDFKGEWPNDCHPGEQKPVIRSYTGDSVLIEFDIITEHVTCNDVATPYRVLVDMSDVIDDVPGDFPAIDVTMRFGGAEFHKVLDKHCLMCDPPPPPRDVRPEAGIYHSDGLEKQGLLLARQNRRLGAYPLIYDESGSSEWLLGAGGIVEDVFFADLLESTGGQCLGCPPPDDPPQMGVVGKISLLMDSEGVIQVKIDDGLFETYQPLAFGYGEFAILGGNGNPVSVPDLSGRWAFADDGSGTAYAQTTPPPTSVLPLVFDVTLRTSVDPPPPVITPPPATAVWYSILDIEGVQVAEMLCEYRDQIVCDLKIPDIESSEHGAWYEVELLSIERMIMRNTAPRDGGIGVGTGTAVRID